MSELPKKLPYPINILYEETYAGGNRYKLYHNYYEIVYVVKGVAKFEVNKKNYSLNANNILFINNLEPHELQIAEYPYKRYIILINPNYLYSIISDPILLSIFKYRPADFKHAIKLKNKDFEKFLSIIKEMRKEDSSKNPLWEMSLGSYFQILMILLFRNYREYFPASTLTTSMNTVVEIQKFIEENFTEPITLQGVSKLYYLDMAYLSRLFKKVTGFAFKEYLLLQRINNAKELLLYTTQNITQVGINSGFNNVNHFIRIFKKYEGITPYQYRLKSKEILLP